MTANNEEIKETALPVSNEEQEVEDSEEELPEVPSFFGRLSSKLFPASFREKKHLALCFLFPALIVFLVYAFRGVYPFGENSVMVLDLNAQYVYFFSYLQDIFAGGHSLVYSFARALSGEFMGLFAYYLASPFSWLVLLFPKENITEALYLIFVLKAGCCGLTMGWYLTKKNSHHPSFAVAFSVMYALCSYAVVMMHNTMWIDCMILLPLIVKGIENVVKERKYKLFVLALAQAILSNFYIGYMMVLFVIVYFFYYYFAHEESELNPNGETNHFAKTTLRMALFGLIAVGIAAVIILPTYTSLQFGKSEFTHPNWGFGQKFDFFNLISKLYFGSYDTVRPEGLPFLFAGMLTTILTPLFFFIPSIKTREKMTSGALLIFMVLSFNTSILDLIWHGFQYPNWLNYRYSFAFVFFLIVLSYKALIHLNEIKFRYVALSCGFFLILLFILQKLDISNVRDLETVWTSAAFICLFLFVLRIYTAPSGTYRRTASVLLTFVVLIEMTCSTVYDIICLDDDVIFSARTGLVDFMEQVEPAVEGVYEMDSSFYRFEKTMHRRTSDNMWLNIRGLTGSTSTLNKSVINFLAKMGMASYSHWSKYKGSSEFLDSMVGIKYVIDYNTGVHELYENTGVAFNEEDPTKTISIFKNPYAFSLAYGVNPKVKELDEIVETKYNDDGSIKEIITAFDSLTSPFKRTSELSKYMLGDLSLADIYTPAKIMTTTNNNVKMLNVVGHKGFEVSDTNRSGSITYQIQITSSDPLYINIPTDYPRECSVEVNNFTTKRICEDNDENPIVALGSFKEGDIVSVKITISNKYNTLYIKTGADIFFYCNQEALLNQLLELRLSSQFDIKEYSETNFEGTIDIAEGRTLVMTSLPYDSGWKVYLDGKAVEAYKVLGTFVAFDATPGQHTLRMVYRPSCLILGGAISVISLTGFVVLCILESRQKKKAQKQAEKAAETEPSGEKV